MDHVIVDLEHAHLGGFVIQKPELDIIYMCAKFDESNFSQSRDHWGRKIKMGHVKLTTPL